MPTGDDVKHFDRRAATYEDSWVQRYVTQLHTMMLDGVGARLPEVAPQRILDIGCGTGRLLRAAGARWPHAELMGVDPAPHMLETARQLLPTARFEAASAEALCATDASLDLVLSSISLHHWADQLQGLREAARVLRPGGLLCLADIALPGWVARVLGSRARSAPAIRHLMVASGLQVVRQERCFAGVVAITLAQKPG